MKTVAKLLLVLSLLGGVAAAFAGKQPQGNNPTTDGFKAWSG